MTHISSPWKLSTVFLSKERGAFDDAQFPGHVVFNVLAQPEVSNSIAHVDRRKCLKKMSCVVFSKWENDQTGRLTSSKTRKRKKNNVLVLVLMYIKIKDNKCIFIVIQNDKLCFCVTILHLFTMGVFLPFCVDPETHGDGRLRVMQVADRICHLKLILAFAACTILLRVP